MGGSASIFHGKIRSSSSFSSLLSADNLFVSEGAGREKVALFDALYSSQTNLC
jgi:hypothetical protein